MSHLNQYIAMLEEAGIVYEIDDRHEQGREVRKSYKVYVERGYNGFFAVLTFDYLGKLVDVGAWE